MKRYCGRDFSPADLLAITTLIEQNPTSNRASLSRQICHLFDWRKPDGGLKDMTCRVAMLRMHADGLITLLPSGMVGTRQRSTWAATTATDAQPTLALPVHELPKLVLRQVTGAANSRLWNEYIARYHYLGYTPLAGSQLRYFVFAGEHLLALISFGASAWKLAARDKFIGWAETERQRNLQLVVNNARFLILPWIQSKGLASKILATASRQLPDDWQQRYGYRPVLLETFVETPRHLGTCYKAANWINVGKTAGRGKKCATHKQIIPIKDIWLYPLRQNFRAVLGG
jgi:Domain of unknown function (DUF4338)